MMYAWVDATNRWPTKSSSRVRMPMRPLAAAALIAVRRDRGPFDVAGVADRDRHVFLGNQILDVELAVASTISVRRSSPYFVLTSRSSSTMICLSSRSLARIAPEPLDRLQQVRELVQDALALQAGQPLQLHVQDRCAWI